MLRRKSGSLRERKTRDCEVVAVKVERRQSEVWYEGWVVAEDQLFSSAYRLASVSDIVTSSFACLAFPALGSIWLAAVV